MWLVGIRIQAAADWQQRALSLEAIAEFVVQQWPHWRCVPVICLVCHPTLPQYMGTIEDAKTALIATGLHDSGMLHVDNFTFVHSNYLKTVEDNMGFTMPPGPDKFTVLSERKYWEVGGRRWCGNKP